MTKGHEEELKGIYFYSCSFVSICGSSLKEIGSFFLE